MAPALCSCLACDIITRLLCCLAPAGGWETCRTPWHSFACWTSPARAAACPYFPPVQVVNDLLDPRRGNLKLREDPKRGFFIEGIKEETLVSAEHALSIIAAGDAHRKVPCGLPACWPCSHLSGHAQSCLLAVSHLRSWCGPPLHQGRPNHKVLCCLSDCGQSRPA